MPARMRCSGSIRFFAMAATFFTSASSTTLSLGPLLHQFHTGVGMELVKKGFFTADWGDGFIAKWISSMCNNNASLPLRGFEDADEGVLAKEVSSPQTVEMGFMPVAYSEPSTLSDGRRMPSSEAHAIHLDLVVQEHFRSHARSSPTDGVACFQRGDAGNSRRLRPVSFSFRESEPCKIFREMPSDRPSRLVKSLKELNLVVA